MGEGHGGTSRRSSCRGFQSLGHCPAWKLPVCLHFFLATPDLHPAFGQQMQDGLSEDLGCDSSKGGSLAPGSHGTACLGNPEPLSLCFGLQPSALLQMIRGAEDTEEPYMIHKG